MNFIVTGCNSDIGRELIKVIVGLDTGKALFVSRSASNSSLSNGGGKYRFLGGIDLTQPQHLEILAREASEIFSSEFAVIHSVGDFWHHKPLEDCSVSAANSMMQSQYLTLFGVIHALVPVMKKVGGGRFVAFSCNSVIYHYPELVPFTASKAAVEALIKCVANEYSACNIYANAIALPTIRTEKVVNSKTQGDLDNYISVTELANIVVEEISNLSKYVTGNIIKIFRHSDTFYNQSYFERNPSGKLP